MLYLNQKGQAFDAFKLLIAAVVAGAILVILLSMIGGFMPVGQDPLTVMGQELNKVKKGGVRSISTSTVQFGVGQEFEADSVAREAGLNQGTVLFCCADTEAGDKANVKCEGYEFDNEDNVGGAFECGGGETTGDTIMVKEGIAGKVMAYCPTESVGKCVVGFEKARG